jgi:hypothetical protein
VTVALTSGLRSGRTTIVASGPLVGTGALGWTATGSVAPVEEAEGPQPNATSARTKSTRIA